MNEYRNTFLDKLKGIFIGHVATYASSSMIPQDAIHEGISINGHYISGHGLAYQLLFDNAKIETQADTITNWKEFLSQPNLQKFFNLVRGCDSNNDKYGGLCYLNDHPFTSQVKSLVNSGSVKLSKLGQQLTEDKSLPLIYASGSLSEMFLLNLPLMVTGYALRNKKPTIGYGLMACGSTLHLRSSMYPISAIFFTKYENDWVNFASTTGIHPAITAAAYFAAPFVVLGAIHYGGRIRDKIKPLAEKMKVENLKSVKNHIKSARKYLRENHNPTDLLDKLQKYLCERPEPIYSQDNFI